MLAKFNLQAALVITSACAASVLQSTHLALVQTRSKITAAPSFSPSFPHGMKVAQIFNSDNCLTARNKENISLWLDMASPACANDTMRHVVDDGQDLCEAVVPAWVVAQELRKSGSAEQLVKYIRNQKAASKWLVHDGFFALTGVEAKRKPRKFRRTPGSLSDQPEETLSFTVVRDPIDAFISGYLEIMYRSIDPDQPCNILSGSSSHALQLLAEKGWTSVSRSDALQLFRTFLEDLEHSRKAGPAFIHVIPQALRIDVGVTLDFIAEVERFKEDFAILFPNVTESDFNTGFSHVSEGVLVKDVLGNITLEAEDEQRLCRILAVDFDCFGYSLPSSCSESPT